MDVVRPDHLGNYRARPSRIRRTRNIQSGRCHPVLLISCYILIGASELHQVLLKRKAIRLRKETGNQQLRARLELDTRSISKTVLTSCIVPFGKRLSQQSHIVHSMLISGYSNCRAGGN
jgi:hypothetical protein